MTQRKSRKTTKSALVTPLNPADFPMKSLTVRGPASPNHKARSQWFQARTAWPVREAPVMTLNRERAQGAVALQAQAAPAAVWEAVGPTNIGGRMTCIVCHPQQPDQLWAGAAGGGVWTSSDAGRNWQALWHNQNSLNIGSLALDPQNPDIIYCGTGEANLSADSYAGVGRADVRIQVLRGCPPTRMRGLASIGRPMAAPLGCS